MLLRGSPSKAVLYFSIAIAISISISISMLLSGSPSSTKLVNYMTDYILLRNVSVILNFDLNVFFFNF